MNHAPLSLALFFTRGLGLRHWVDSGLISREILLYELHLRHKNLNSVFWITYGDQAEEERLFQSLPLSKESKNIRILGKPEWLAWLPNVVYWMLIPLVHYNSLSKCEIMKSNQMDGAWAAWWSSFLLRKKFYLRTGYTWSLFIPSNLKRKSVQFIEKFLYRHCSCFAVSSKEDYQYVMNYYPQAEGMILRNFIDVNLYTSDGVIPSPASFVTVARFNQQKNLINLVLAFKNLPYPLTIIGEGELKADIQKLLAAEKIENVNLHPRVSNSELVQILKKHSHFILPSLFEGNPKALLEAMSLGMLCVVTNVPGNREIIKDDENGILAVSTDSRHIREAILRSINADGRLRINAIKYVKQYHDLNSIAGEEKNFLSSL